MSEDSATCPECGHSCYPHRKPPSKAPENPPPPPVGPAPTCKLVMYSATCTNCRYRFLVDLRGEPGEA
jgi:hypothetical protein